VETGCDEQPTRFELVVNLKSAKTFLRQIPRGCSQPLSPAATQHSLPSGRYSLLGPDLHRLDRTSLRLAHLFDNLVGGGERRRGYFKPSAPIARYSYPSSLTQCKNDRQAGGSKPSLKLKYHAGQFEASQPFLLMLSAPPESSRSRCATSRVLPAP
jgi:hypothetical protein